MRYQILYTTKTGQRSSSKASSLNEALVKAEDYNKRYGCLCLIYEEHRTSGMALAAKVKLDGRIEKVRK